MESKFLKKTGTGLLCLALALGQGLWGNTARAGGLSGEEELFDWDFSIEEDDLDAQMPPEVLASEEMFSEDDLFFEDDFFSIEEDDISSDALWRLSSEGIVKESAYEVGAGYPRVSVVVDESAWVIKSYGFKLRRQDRANEVSASAEEEASLMDDIAMEEAEIVWDEGFGAEDLLSDGEGESPYLDAEEPYESVYEDAPAVYLSPSELFYTSLDGVVQVTTVNRETGKRHTGRYIFDENGKMLTGRRTLAPGTPGQAYNYTSYKLCLFTPSALAALYDEYEGQNVAMTPLNSDIGQRKDNYWYWDAPTGKFQYFDNDGNRYPMGDLNVQYASVGYYYIRGAYYQLMSSGRPRTGLREINGSLYYFREDSEIPGQMVLGEWVRLYTKTSTRYLYFQPASAGADKGKALMHDGYHVARVPAGDKSVLYLLNQNGYVMKNRMKLQAGDGAFYCSDGNGKVYQDTFIENGRSTYYAQADGTLFKEGSLVVDGRTYLFENYILKKEIKEETPARLGGVADYGALHVEGAHLISADGRRVQLRGISTHGINWFPEYVNAAAFKEYRETWGANVMRLAMYTAEYNGYMTGGNRTALKNLIRQGVGYATDNDMYVIVDWHILSDNNPLTYKDEAKAFFREMAGEFSSHNNVLYEICNEPNGGTTWADVRAYAREVIPVIRACDPDAVILVGSPEWSQRVDLAAAEPLSEFDNIMYTLHFYAGTHKSDLRLRMERAAAAGLPIFVSEYGICDASGNGALDKAEAGRWVASMDKLGISYVNWNLSNKAESSSIVSAGCRKTSGFAQSDLTESGQWLYALLSGKAGSGGMISDGQSGGTSSEKPGEGTSGNTSGQASSTQSTLPSGIRAAEMPGLTVTITPDGSWSSGGQAFFLYRLSAVNTGTAPINGWKAEIIFDGSFELSDSWNGEFLKLSSTKLQIKNKDYNAVIAPGGSVSDVGFIVSIQ